MAEPIVLIAGDAPTFRIKVTLPPPDSTAVGDPFDLANYNANFLIKRSLQDADSAAEFNGTFSSGIAVAYHTYDGIIDITIPKTVTSNLRIGRLYPWMLILTNEGDSSKVFIPIRGTFLITIPDSE